MLGPTDKHQSLLHVLGLRCISKEGCGEVVQVEWSFAMPWESNANVKMQRECVVTTNCPCSVLAFVRCRLVGTTLRIQKTEAISGDRRNDLELAVRRQAT